jgi:hypothetical protein
LRHLFQQIHGDELNAALLNDKAQNWRLEAADTGRQDGGRHMAATILVASARGFQPRVP